MPRKAMYPIQPIFVERWSPRAMSGEPLSDTELMSLFEAARWAPSSYNAQSWRFVYAKNGSAHWATFFDLLVPFNQSWCNRAAVLMVICSRDTFPWNGKPSRTHSFDTGAAWQNMALQAHAMGLVMHGLEGFDYERAKIQLGIPNGYTIEAMVACGKPGKKEDLPQELQPREELSDRNPVSAFIFEGMFKEAQ